MWHKILFFAFLATLIITGSVWADLTVTVGNLELVQGKTDYVDVTVAGKSDLLQAFGFEFRIRTTSGATRLQFADPQPYDYLSDSNYVFAGDSLDFDTCSVGNVSGFEVPGDTFMGGDMTSNGANVTVTDAKLLIRLQVTAATSLPPEVGNSFSVSLEPSSSSYFSYFSDDVSNEVTYAASSGTVTIVPEPGTTTLLLMMSAFLILGNQFYKRF